MPQMALMYNMTEETPPPRLRPPRPDTLGARIEALVEHIENLRQQQLPRSTEHAELTALGVAWSRRKLFPEDAP
jgi:hypothetical protein